MLLFFDLVFEANFNDLRLQFGGPKTMKFEKIEVFWQPWWWFCFGNAFGFDFGAFLKRPGAKLEGLWFQKRPESEDFLRNSMQNANWACCQRRAA